MSPFLPLTVSGLLLAAAFAPLFMLFLPSTAAQPLENRQALARASTRLLVGSVAFMLLSAIVWRFSGY